MFMVDFKKALQLILDNSGLRPIQRMGIQECHGFVLGEDIRSKITMPPFNQSAMDGYAIADPNQPKYYINGEIKAGDNSIVRLQKDHAIRIFTGAMTPENSFAVIKQEETSIEDDILYIEQKNIIPFENIRKAGEQIKENEIAVFKGTRLTPSVIGYLSSLGITELEVYSKPNVSIINTGSELVQPGKSLEPGQIYESNSIMLQSAVKSQGIDCSQNYCKDDLDATKDAIEKGLEHSDILILTGGISAGSYDFVKEALALNNVETIFHKVLQKPGKPLFFGKKGAKLIFGLPGNPAAAMICFYVYVIPAIRKIQGQNNYELLRLKGPLLDRFAKNSELTFFLKANWSIEGIKILPKQSSAMLGDFTHANCLAIFEDGKEEWKKGEDTQVLILNEY